MAYTIHLCAIGSRLEQWSSTPNSGIECRKVMLCSTHDFGWFMPSGPYSISKVPEACPIGRLERLENAMEDLIVAVSK